MREGGKNADYDAKDVIAPLLDTVLEDSEENTLRPLVEAETVRISHSISTCNI